MKPYGTVGLDLWEDTSLRKGDYGRYGNPNSGGYKSSSKRYKHRARQKAKRIINVEELV